MSLLFPKLLTVPDFSRPPRRGISTVHDRTAMGAAQQTVFFPQHRHDYLFDFRFAFTLAFDIQATKEFFRARGGRSEPFYIPTWQRDLTIVGAAAAGTQQIQIASPADDYEATHLTATENDHYGRQLYFWKDGKPVHIDSILRVLPGDAAGQEILDMDNPLPFAVDEDTWIGWAHLVRFTQDKIDWKHWSPTAAETEIGFRGMRQHNLNELEIAVAQADQYGQNGFVSCSLAPGEILPVTNRVGYSYGPDSLHASQDDPYAMPWAVFPSSDGIHIRKALPPANAVIWLPSESGTLSVLFSAAVSTDHVSLAFDQNAYEVIAYQKTASTIECRRFFNSAVETVTWEGQDPVLIFNGLLDADLLTGDTDVVCYYLKAGENVLYSRFQRDNFGTEYIAALLPSRPLALKRAYFEYNGDASAGTLKVEFVDAGLRLGILSSASYPDPPPPPVPPYVEIAVEDHGSATGAITGGDYAYAVIWADGGGEFDPHPTFSETATATGSVTGSYDSLVVWADGGGEFDPHPAFSETATATGSVTGSYALNAVPDGNSLVEFGDATGNIPSGIYALNVISPPANNEQATTSATVTGVYELA